MKFTVFCVLLTVIHFAVPYYVFQTGIISYKRIKGKKVTNRTYGRVTTIDQHLFADAREIKVRANMTMFEGAIKNIPHLKVLRLKECGIKKLPPKTFQNLPNLRVVHLQDNNITRIETRVFNYLPIRILWLHRNQISMIQSSAFDNMPQLEVIKLNENMLSKWDSRWFANTPNLRRLLFKRNMITELPPRAFVNIKPSHKVKGEELVDTQIFLCSNDIADIHPEALHGISALDLLSFRKNKLKEVDWEIFSEMSELHTLSLERNKLSKIDKNAFDNLSELLVLNLAKNEFECVPYEIARKAKKVDLSGNEELDCECIANLIDKLEDKDIDNEIVVKNSECEEE